MFKAYAFFVDGKLVATDVQVELANKVACICGREYCCEKLLIICDTGVFNELLGRGLEYVEINGIKIHYARFLGILDDDILVQDTYCKIIVSIPIINIRNFTIEDYCGYEFYMTTNN